MYLRIDRLPVTAAIPLATAIGGLGFVGALAVLSPFDHSEQLLVNRLAGRQLFRPPQ